MNRAWSSFVGKLVGLFAILTVLGSVAAEAQQYTVIPNYATGGTASKQYSSYHYIYNYPVDYTNIYALYMFYDCYDRAYQEWVLLATDMRQAGLCPGPINGLGMRFLRVPQAWTNRLRIWLRQIPATQTGINNYGPTNVANLGYSTPTPANGAVLVHDDTWTLPIIGANDSTWVDFSFNQPTQFIWDGTSNLMIGMYRCQTSGSQCTGQYAEFLCVEQNPPASGNSYWGSGYPWFIYFGYYYYNAGNCDNWGGYYSYTFPYLYYYNYQPPYNYSYKPMRPVTRLRASSGLTQSFPDDADPRRITRAGEVYGGQDAAHPKPSLTFYQQAGKTYQYRYRVMGPKPATTVLYESRQGTNPYITYTGTANGAVTVPVSGATGTLAQANGTLDLTNAGGGSYTVAIDFISDCGTLSWAKEFIVAFQNDVATVSIRSPQERPKKNPLYVSLPLSAQIQNVGLNPVTNVTVRGIVRNASNVVVYDETTNWTGNLSTGDRAVVDFNTTLFTPTAVGLYTVQMCATLNNAVDMQAANDCLPSAGNNHIFEVSYNEEPGAGQIVVPNGNSRYFANRPLMPQGEVINGGILDLSDVPVRMEIFRNPGRVRVYNERVIVQSVDAAAPNNYAAAQFPVFTPTQAGNYEACMTVEYGGDPDMNNNVTCRTFTVDANLEGTYTIGTKFLGNARNYATFDAAASDLYLKGVSGAVTFELTDASYDLNGNAANGGFALDLAGYIAGMSDKNTVTFKPSVERSLTRGSIKVNLNTSNGIGFRFGQALTPSNQQAIGRQFPNIRMYSNSNGYFTFDGGTQKSIRFELNATTPFRSAFYLGDGSHNITVKNVVITNGATSTPSYTTSVPKVFFVVGQFQFDEDSRTVSGNPVTYSAGIISRAKRPAGINGNNSELLDTIKNDNNRFMGNEISGFGYGIVSLGIGTLIKGGINEFRPYYNTGTEISGNLIYNVAGAGVYVGNEEGVKIENNRIYNVGKSTGAAAKTAAGIVAGGTDVYNVMDARINANEISAVRGDSTSRGVVVEQNRNVFQSVSSSGFYFAPHREEHSIVSSNSVWGLQRGTTSGSIAGVHLLTRRLNSSVVTPASGQNDYFTRKDSIVNNTIYVANDNLTGPGIIAGIASQHGNGTVVKNNAIAIESGANAATTAQAAIMYQGTPWRTTRANTWFLPSNAPAALVSDRNAFYTPNSGIAHFVEIDEVSEVVSGGSPSEFTTLAQWRGWTMMDINSVSGNFIAEHEFQGIAPNQRLRVKTTPQAPLGSILNNRGERLSTVAVDVDGSMRGEAGLGYDLGADEFNGRLYVSDIEVIDITKPSVYRSQTGSTSDAEYVMTKAPVDVTARVRNNGALTNTNAGVRVRVFLETAASNNSASTTPTWNATPVVDRVVSTALASGESKDITFNIPSWTPQTYYGLAGYTVPSRFSTMAWNVTPRYRIEVVTNSDENNANNTYAKTVRFYLQKSHMSIIASVTGSTVNINQGTPTANQIAAKLNGDSLMKAINDLGFINDPANNIYSYDIFDRSSWEPRAVDYTIYRTMMWAHDQNAFSRTERDDIRNFVAAATPTSKKNLVVGTQEAARKHVGATIIADEKFVNTVLRAQNAAPGTPYSPTYNGRRITGDANARGSMETIVRTGFAGDADPVPALLKVYSDNTTPGVANKAYIYNKADRTSADSIMGTSTSSLSVNTIYLGVDWRHYQRNAIRTGGERVLRGVVDFFETNGGTVVPVELLSFDAEARGTDVDVFWSTASEQNSDHFIVERARIEGESVSTFNQVSLVPAAGNTTQRRDYAVQDKGLASGTYVYRLVAVDKDGSTSNGGEVQVVVATEGAGLWMSDVTPNPVQNHAVVNFRLETSEEVSMMLVDVNGREVLTVATGFRTAGNHEQELNTANIPAGSYTLVLRSNGMMVTKTITVVK